MGGGDCVLMSLLVVFLEKKEKGLLNFRAMEGKVEGEVTFSGIMDAGGMVRVGEDIFGVDASSDISFCSIVWIEDFVVVRECEGGTGFESGHMLALNQSVSLLERSICCMDTDGDQICA